MLQNRMMKTKILHIAFLCLAFSTIGKAQIDSSYIDMREEYQNFWEQALKEYNDFKKHAQTEFEQFLAEAWKEYEGFAATSGLYSKKKPETIPSIETSSGIIEVEAPSLFETMPAFEEVEQEQKDAFFDAKSSYLTDAVSVNFYGRPLDFRLPQNLRITASGTRERQISKYYQTMRQNDANQVLMKQLDAAVSQMGLNEWGYFALLRTIAEKIFDDTNDRVLFCFYMLHSRGFKARVARGSKSGNLQLLLALDNKKEVYSLTYFRIRNTKFYIVYGNGQKGESIYSYDEKADDSGLKEIGLDFKKTLSITRCDKKRKLHLGKANLDIELPYSSAHLSYYDDIPTTVFPIYFKTAVANETEQVLAETFGTLGKQYNKVQLVDIMLNFVQTAFAYKIDELQFGREKYFFPEEVIGRPFSDCEDRSALFAWLVRHYIGYDVVGVLYDDHLATAICFGNDAQIEGKSIMLHGKRYIICDPTYSNASIGTVMPKFANARYEIVEIN